MGWSLENEFEVIFYTIELIIKRNHSLLLDFVDSGIGAMDLLFVKCKNIVITKPYP